MSNDNDVGTPRFALVNLLAVVLGAVAGRLLVEAFPLLDDVEGNQIIGVSLGAVLGLVIIGRIRAQKNRH